MTHVRNTFCSFFEQTVHHHDDEDDDDDFETVVKKKPAKKPARSPQKSATIPQSLALILFFPSTGISLLSSFLFLQSLMINSIRQCTLDSLTRCFGLCVLIPFCFLFCFDAAWKGRDPGQRASPSPQRRAQKSPRGLKRSPRRLLR